MEYKISLSLVGWEIETETITTEDGDKVSALYANGLDPLMKTPGFIEIYAGDLNGSDAKTECLNNYDTAIGLEEGEDPVREIPFCGKDGWYYDCEMDGMPAIVICVEIRKGVLVIATLAEKNEELLDDLIGFVDENLKIE